MEIGRPPKAPKQYPFRGQWKTSESLLSVGGLVTSLESSELLKETLEC